MTPLIALDDLPDRAARGFVAPEGEAIFLVRSGDRVRGFVNRCPHQDVPLDEAGGGFLVADGRRIRCSKHGAEFRVEDGLCVLGPCRGWRLAAVPVTIKDGWIVV